MEIVNNAWVQGGALLTLVVLLAVGIVHLVRTNTKLVDKHENERRETRQEYTSTLKEIHDDNKEVLKDLSYNVRSQSMVLEGLKTLIEQQRK